MRARRIEKNSAVKQPTIINEKLDNLSAAVAAPEMSAEILRTINQPIRTVVYVEVGDASQEQIMNLLRAVNEAYKSNEGGIHYVIPVRNGKLRTEIEFEQEFLETIRKICTIRDGQIVFTDGMKETVVIREKAE
jgi:hypothetical protein